MKKIIVMLVVVVAIFATTGCSMEVSARGNAYYPKENGGDIYKSRAVEHSNTGSWSWGNAGK